MKTNNSLESSANSSPILPGSFEYAPCYLLDHDLYLGEFDARFRNERSARPRIRLTCCSRSCCSATRAGLVSSRAIESACRDNVLFMALSSDARPHFTTIAAFASELGEATVAFSLRCRSCVIGRN